MEVKEVFKPLEVLKTLDPPPSHVILSVGGNDIRHILGNISKLPEVISAFAEMFPKVIDSIQQVCPKLMIQLQYRPSVDMDQCYGVYAAISQTPFPGSPVEKIGLLMQTIYAPVFKVAREKGIPIIDMARSFDLNDPSLYVSQIEPSELGSKIIADTIAHCVNNHQVNDGSQFYYSLPG